MEAYKIWYKEGNYCNFIETQFLPSYELNDPLLFEAISRLKRHKKDSGFPKSDDVKIVITKNHKIIKEWKE